MVEGYFERALREQLANYAMFGSEPSKYGGETMYTPKRTDLDELVKTLRDLASEEPGVNLAAVTKAVETVNAEHKRRIERALESIADLEKLKKPKGRRFVVAYWYDNASAVAEGIEYPRSTDDDSDVYRVYVDARGHVALDSYYETMDALRKDLAEVNAFHCVVYLDK